MIGFEIITMIAFAFLAGEILTGLALIPTLPIMVGAGAYFGLGSNTPQTSQIINKIFRMHGLFMVLVLLIFLVIFWYYNWGMFAFKPLLRNPLVVFALLAIIALVSTFFNTQRSDLLWKVFTQVSGAWKWRLLTALGLMATEMPADSAVTWATVIGGGFTVLIFGFRYYREILINRKFLTGNYGNYRDHQTSDLLSIETVILL